MFVVGTPSGNRDLKNPVVGTASGNKPVSKIWVGSSGGNKLVWERWRLTTSMTATGTSQTNIRLDWTPTEGATYRLYRTGGPSTTGPLPNDPNGLSYLDGGLTAGARYDYRLDILRGTEVVGSVTAFAATGDAPPPPTTQQRFWEGRAVGSASYNGAGNNRSVPEMYFGQYSGTNGLQKSAFWFDIPAELRNCVSVDRIDLAVWGLHTFSGGGTDVDLAIIHSAPGSKWAGSTGALRHNGADWPFRARISGWMGTWVDASGWNTNVHVLSDPGRGISMADEFRTQGAVGIALSPRTTLQSGYGYAAGSSHANYPRARFWYTVRT
jgi:hypothetical protein